MATLLVDHEVTDYDAWRTVYDSVDEARTRAGVTSHRVYRDVANPNHVVVEHVFADAASAGAFLENTELREILGRAGVVPSTLRAVVADDVS
jgi:quinol monooxygenase YgiN